MRTLGNLIWLILAGWWLAIGYALAGLLMMILIITIPFGIQAFKLAGYVIWPFGRAVVPIPKSAAAKAPSVVANILWFVLAGIWLAIGHIVSAILLAITIIGIPFAVVSFKMAGLALFPFGKTVVPARVAEDYGEPGQVIVVGGPPR